MTTRQSLEDKLVFFTDKGESTLPPECALIVLTSTLATPVTFLHQHFLHELLRKETEGVVFLSFLSGLDKFANGVKRLVIPPFPRYSWGIR